MVMQVFSGKRGVQVESRILPEMKFKHASLRYTMEGEGKEQKESLSDVVQGFSVAFFCRIRKQGAVLRNP